MISKLDLNEIRTILKTLNQKKNNIKIEKLSNSADLTDVIRKINEIIIKIKKI